MTYSEWYNANTMFSFEEWTDKSRMELIDKLRALAWKGV